MEDAAVRDVRAAKTAKTSGPRRQQVAAVADTFVALVRSFGRARARMLAAAEHDVEWSAHILLKVLKNEGPMRAGALAECTHSDPSTVSRQVAALVGNGLLERRADPVDGRASLLVLTPKADEVLAEHDEIRLDFFARTLQNWTPDELEQFAARLARFTSDYENANHDMSERIAHRAAHAGGDR